MNILYRYSGIVKLLGIVVLVAALMLSGSGLALAQLSGGSPAPIGQPASGGAAGTTSSFPTAGSTPAPASAPQSLDSGSPFNPNAGSSFIPPSQFSQETIDLLGRNIRVEPTAEPQIINACERGLRSIQDVTAFVLCLINDYLVPLMFAVATLLFIAGVIWYVIAPRENKKDREKGKQYMFWGLVGLFVMTAMWGLVNILVSTLFGTTSLVIPQLPTS